MRRLKIPIKNFSILFFILILGFLFRFNNLNWDNNFHLHPDERFLTMVGGALVLPKNISQYLDPTASLLNPGNLGYHFFVYGTFPLTLNKYLAVLTGKDNYNEFTILGRFLSASFDFLIIIFIFKTLKLLFPKEKKIPLWGAFFYAVSVYPIQSAHFFTVDTFLNFFMFASFYFILRQNIILSAIFFGLAAASKISAVFILPLILIFIIFHDFILPRAAVENKKSSLPLRIVMIGIFLIISYVTVRFANPYYFQNANFFDFRLNGDFVLSIKQLKSFERKDIWYPPAVQWINKPVWALLSTTFFAGLGPVNFLVMAIGLFFIANSKFKIADRKKVIFYLIIFWVVGYFIYQSVQFVKSIRYTIYLYPFFAIFGGVGISVISYWLSVIGKKFFKNKLYLYVLHCTLFVLLLSWPLLFSTIYFYKNTRVEASEWIYKNLKNNSVILGEHWDDPLPLPLEGNFGKSFQIELLPVFDQETKEKWKTMRDLLNGADYYILSSNRGWGSIPKVPEKYPKMSQYYQALLSNDCQKQKELTGVCYKKIKEFLPYYYQFIRYPDSWIEETFTVYDHPTVLVLKKY